MKKLKLLFENDYHTKTQPIIKSVTDLSTSFDAFDEIRNL